MARAAAVSLVVAALACGSGAPPCGPRPDVVACLDDTPITVEAALQHRRTPEPIPGRVALPDPAQRAVDAAVRVQLFADEARRRGLGGGDTRVAALHQALLADERSRLPAISDADADAFYASHPGRVSKVEAVRPRAIFLMDSTTAERIAARAVGLDDAGFAALAEAESHDPSAASGGDLGVLDDAHSPRDLVRAASALREAGDLIGPLVTDDRRYVILRATTVEVRLEPLDQVRPRVKRYLARQAEQAALDELAARLLVGHRVRRFDTEIERLARLPIGPL